LLFVILSTFFLAVRATSCEQAKTNYLSKIDNYLITYYFYDQSCGRIGLNASRSCMEMGYYCWYNGNRYYSISTNYLVDFEELSYCVDKINGCAKSLNATEECYNCGSYIVNFYDAILSAGSNASSTFDCSKTHRPECYEKAAWEYCVNATKECEIAWNSLCVSHRDALWRLYYAICGAVTDYIDQCSTTVPNYCDNVKKKKYSQSDCNRYMADLEFCPIIASMNSVKDIESLIDQLKRSLRQTQSTRTEEFEKCFEDMNIADVMAKTKMDSIYLVSTSSSDFSFLPLVTTLTVGLFVGLVVGIKFSKQRKYQSIPHSTEVN